MIELERTYLVTELPADLKDFPFKEILDIYLPEASDHPVLRVRKNGERREITKKQPLTEGDASQQDEQTIILSDAEFQALRTVRGKQIRKLRYAYPYGQHTIEVDVFQDALSGLVLADVEFSTLDELEQFQTPTWFSSEVTRVQFLAGGMLAGKSFQDIQDQLQKLQRG